MFKAMSIAVLALVFLLIGDGLPVSAERSKLLNDMVLIKGGTFKRGCNRFGPQHGAPEQKVHLDSYWIDKYEVTNKKFEEIFPEHNLRRSIFSDCDDCAVSKVSWYESADYCHIIGKSLPSEAQWERAAGNGNGCEFPWGDGFDLINPPARGGVKLHDKAFPVGSFPPNQQGLYDAAGNVWEWVADWFSIRFYYADILHNPRGPVNGVMKVRRGGSWSDSVKAMASGYRDWSYPHSRGFTDIGFRCSINMKSGDR
jgi:formylglycine-generating enzyme required for sulfatase activity